MASKISSFQFEQEYKYIKEIGSGTFGKVFEYEEKKTGHRIAVKQITCYTFEEFTTSIQELTLLSRATHKNIIKINHFCMVKESKKILGGQSEDIYQLYILMELADHSLDFEITERFKNNHYFSNKRLFYLVYDLISALYFMQKIQMSHRDIKPHNVLSVKGTYQLTDFGVSKSLEDMQTFDNKTLTGSPPYLAPVLRQNYEKRIYKVNHNCYLSDVFSLGLVFLCGAGLQDVSSLNADEDKKNKMIDQLAAQGRYGQWFIDLLRNMLNFNEEQRWDFIQIRNFIQQVQQDPTNKLLENVKIQEEITAKTTKDIKNLSSTQQKLTINSFDARDQNTFNLFLNADNFKDQQAQQHKKSKSTQEEFKQEVNPIQLKNSQSSSQKKKQAQKSQNGSVDIPLGTSNTLFSTNPNSFITLPDGAKFNGNILQGQREGQGECLYQDGMQYKGNFLKDVREGYGKAIYPNQKAYEGEWKMGLRHGKGRIWYPNGDFYQGQFQNDLKSGKGKFENHACEIYEGNYLKGEKHGQGNQFYCDGTKYEGEWKNGKRDGNGVLIRSDNKVIFEGQWKNNYYDNGKLYNHEQKKIMEGNFKKHQPHGEMKIYKIGKPDDFEIIIYENGKLMDPENTI